MDKKFLRLADDAGDISSIVIVLAAVWVKAKRYQILTTTQEVFNNRRRCRAYTKNESRVTLMSDFLPTSLNFWASFRVCTMLCTNYYWSRGRMSAGCIKRPFSTSAAAVGHNVDGLGDLDERTNEPCLFNGPNWSNHSTHSTFTYLTFKLQHQRDEAFYHRIALESRSFIFPFYAINFSRRLGCHLISTDMNLYIFPRKGQ